MGKMGKNGEKWEKMGKNVHRFALFMLVVALKEGKK
jgi:hypothetical protein